jgi:hypothetical protein
VSETKAYYDSTGLYIIDPVWNYKMFQTRHPDFIKGLNRREKKRIFGTRRMRERRHGQLEAYRQRGMLGALS